MNMRAIDLARHWPLSQEWVRINSRGAVAMAVAATLGAALLALLTRKLLGHQPLYDELLHILAARGFLATGEPVIGDGIYDRAELYTRLVALAFQYFGDTLVAARMPAWIGTLALVALTGAWVVRRAGFIAGCAAATLLAINLYTLELAVFARFYTLHALSITVMFVAFHESFARDRRPQVRGLFLVIAAFAAAVAWHLQITTLVAMGAAGAGALMVFAIDHRELLLRVVMKRPVAMGAGLAILAILGTWIMNEVGLIDRLGTAPAWAADRVNSREYYNSVLSEDLPLLWPLAPLAFLASLYVDRRLAVFCGVVALAALFVHSIAAQKATRYIYYLLPLLCVLWGCGIARSVDLLAGWGARVLPAAARAAGVLALGLIAVMILNSTEGRRAARLMAGRTAIQELSYGHEADWSKVGSALKAQSGTAAATITSNSMKALYFIGDYDFELNASTVQETRSGEEFGIDPRTGRPVISNAQSLSSVLDGPGSKLVIVELRKLRQPAGVTGEVVDLLEARCSPIGGDLEAGGIVAWSCAAPFAAAEACTDCASTANAAASEESSPQ